MVGGLVGGLKPGAALVVICLALVTLQPLSTVPTVTGCHLVGCSGVFCFVRDDIPGSRNLSEMTFRGLGIWDLGIMTRVGVRKLGEIDGLGLEQSTMG